MSGLYCHRQHMAQLKDDRLQIRVDPEDKQLLEQAATASHQTLSAFVFQAAALRADEILAEPTVIKLAPEAAEAFERALAAPASVNTRLANALERPRGFRWVD